LRWSFFVLMLASLPLLGIIAFGRDPAPYLEIPPTTRYVRHAGFSWSWFIFFTVVDLLLIGGLLWAVHCGYKRKPDTAETPASPGVFPWWGWAGLILCLINWLLAWQRFTWFWLFQPHTFLPIWAGFILTVNALAVKRSGSCLILRRPVRFVLLFPASAGFWWFFEYLNRFVQNWYYTGIEGMGPGEYSYFSSLAFATVLPGVLSMIDLLNTVPGPGPGPGPLPARRPPHPPGGLPRVTLATARRRAGPDRHLSRCALCPAVGLAPAHRPLRPGPDRPADPSLSTAIRRLAPGGRPGPGGARLRLLLGNLELLQPGPLDLRHPLCPAVPPVRNADPGLRGIPALRPGVPAGRHPGDR
jgi:hypothetical protein